LISHFYLLIAGTAYPETSWLGFLEISQTHKKADIIFKNVISFFEDV